MTNLAGFLENSAQSYPDRTAIVFGDTRLSYPQVNGAANQVANLLVSRGIQPGDKVAISCPNLPYFSIIYYGILKAGATVVPLNVLLKGREVAYHLGDSDAKAYFAFQGTPDLPIGAEAHAGFEQADGCEHFFVVTADPTAPSPIEGTETFGQALAGQAPDLRHGRRRRRRHGRHPLHLRHHRPAQGRRAAPPQHARQRAGGHGPLRRRPFAPRHLPLRAAAVPLVRPDRHPERRLRLRRHRRDAAALRGRARDRPDAQGVGDLLRRRADDVLGPAQRPRRDRRREDPRRQPPRRGRRWCRAARRGPPPVRGALRRDHPRGLRPLGDLAGRELLAPGPGRPRGLHRHPDPRCRDEADRPRELGGGQGPRRHRRDRHSRATTS